MKTTWIDAENKIILYEQEEHELIDSCIHSVQPGYKGMIISKDYDYHGKVIFRDFLILSKYTSPKEAEKFEILFRYLDDISFQDIVKAIGNSTKVGQFKITMFDINTFVERKLEEKQRRLEQSMDHLLEDLGFQFH